MLTRDRDNLQNTKNEQLGKQIRVAEFSLQMFDASRVAAPSLDERISSRARRRWVEGAESFPALTRYREVNSRSRA
jgi:hypothetical protein